MGSPAFTYPPLGVQVHVTPILPTHPTFSESIRRRVRHGLADVLEWLGEDVGPYPDEPTHAFRIGNSLYVSQWLYDSLKAEL